MGLVGGLCFGALGLMLVAYIFVSKSWVIVRHGSTMLVERFGQFHKQCKPGMHFLIPFVDHPRKVHWRYVDVRRNGNSHETYVVRKTTSVIDLREHVLDFGQQLVITKDTVNIVIDALLYYQIQDARLAALKIRNLPDALELLTQATLRNIMANITLDDSFSSRDNINQKLMERIAPDCCRFGANITRVEIQDISPSQEILTAMETQLIAERERRSLVLRADGDRESAIIKSLGDSEAMVRRADAAKAVAKKQAEGEAQARLAMAGATSECINCMRGMLDHVGSELKATDYSLAVEYLDTLRSLPVPAKKVTLVPREGLDVMKQVASMTK